MTGDRFAGWNTANYPPKAPGAFITRHPSLITRHSLSNPFQGGMGFSTRIRIQSAFAGHLGRNPFQGGVGFSTALDRRGENEAAI